jgi:DNA-binding CsgD family transcriptional regulator/pimeloyl-ACP methyl ester carboxylesterase
LGGESGCGDVVVAEGLGEDRGGHVQDVLADGAGPAGGGGDAEVADERGEGVGVHGLPGAAAGKQPAGVVVGGGVHVVAVVHPGEQEVGDWSGQRGWRVPEPQQDLVAVMDYVIDGQADDPAEGLGVEQDDDGRDPGPQWQVAAGQEVAELDVRDLLPRIDLPTLILHCTGDSWIDVGHARYLAENIPNATYVELPGADHRPWLGDVDAIANEIEVFLTGRTRRPRRRTDIGLDALSRREREVAVLASRGQTAQEIADSLFVSKRTVESHLVSIYAKLGVDSKTELIRRASDLGL